MVPCLQQKMHKPGACPNQSLCITVLQRTVSRRNTNLVSSVWQTLANLLSNLLHHVSNRGPGRAWPCAQESCSRSLFSLPIITTEPVQGLKNHTLTCTTCLGGLSSWHPGKITRLAALGNPSSSKAPVKHAQCHWHILANESGSWPVGLYLKVCFPF